MLPRSYGSSMQRERAPPPSEGQRLQAPDPRLPGAKVTKLEGLPVPTWPITSNFITFVGLGVLALIMTLPASDAMILLHDYNYVFWAGQALPTVIIVVLVLTLVIYFPVARGLSKTITRSHIVTLTTTFLTLLGVILIFGSMYLYYRDMVVSDALQYSCKGSYITRDVRRYYVDLLSLRRTSSCSSMQSVEDCSGYDAAAPPEYANYLKYMEENFRCSGFCYTAGNASLVQVDNTLPLAPVGRDALTQVSSAFLGRDTEFVTMDTKKFASLHRASSLPPALFSTMSYQTSCDGAASRDLSNMASRISEVWWYEALVLLGFSIVIGFTDWCSASKVRVG